MLALKSDKSLIEKVLLFKKDDDDDLFEPSFATERLKLFINVILVVEVKNYGSLKARFLVKKG